MFYTCIQHFSQIDFISGNPFPSSDNFDVKQMITLIRNFTEIEIVDVLPKSSNKSKGADLSRLKFYRNSIVHNDGSFSKEDFTSYWNDICKVNITVLLVSEHKEKLSYLTYTRQASILLFPIFQNENVSITSHKSVIIYEC